MPGWNDPIQSVAALVLISKRDLAKHPQVVAANQAVERGDLTEAERLFRALVNRLAHQPDELALQANCLCGLARVLIPQKRFAEAEESLGHATQIIDRLRVVGSRLHASVLSTVAHLRLEQGQPGAAESILATAREMLRAKPRSPTDSLLVDIPRLQAKAALQQARHADAERYILEAIQNHQPCAEQQPQMSARLAIDFAALRREEGRCGEAKEALSEAMAYAGRAGPAGELLRCEVLMSLAALAISEARYDQAEMHAREALQSRQSRLGSGHHSTIDSLNTLGIAILRQGRFSEAESLFEQVLGAQRANPSTAAGQAITMNNLAVTYREQGRLEEAEAMQRRALDKQQGAMGKEHPALANTLKNLAIVLHKRGQIEPGREAALRALAIARPVYGPDHPQVREIVALLDSMS